VWANFRLPHEESELSLNALPGYLLEKMHVPPRGFLGFTDEVRRRVPVLGSYMRVPAEERALLEDYRLLQYDLLLGSQYSQRGRAP
jgi:hypothetical protein